ncbi:MAG TPA: tetratricopeptide repeat protein [Candidatus Obscuribacterales bacterium]
MSKGKKQAGQAKGRGWDLARILKTSPTKIPKVAKEAAIGAPPPVRWRTLCLMALALAGLVVACFLDSLPGELVFNDRSTLQFLSTISDWDYFWTDLWTRAFTRPLTQQWLKATYAWDFQAAGMHLIWYHVVNVGLHLVSCMYLFFLVFRIARTWHNQGRLDADPYRAAFASAALFACHPLACESVAYLSARSAPLLAANYFLCLDCFLLGYLGRSKAIKFWGYGLSAIFLFLGLLVSPGALTLPLTMLVLAAMLKPPSQHWLDWATGWRWSLAAVLLLLGALPYLTLGGVVLHPGNGAGLEVLPAESYWASQFKGLITYYVRCFVVPIGLSVDPPWVVASSWLDPLTLSGIILVVACAAGIWLLRARPLVSFGLFLFLIGFIPESFIVQPEVIADRRMYLSLAGLCLIAGWAVAKLAERSLRRALIAFSLVVAVLCSLTIWRNWEWGSNQRLWEATLRVNPDNARAHANLALELLRRGKTSEAASEAKRSIKIDPGLSQGFLAVGAVLFHGKDYSGAADAFSRAAELARQHNLGNDLLGAAKSGLARSYLEIEQYNAAGMAAREALDAGVDSADMHMVLGRSYAEHKRHNLAMFELQTALKMDPRLSSCWAPLARSAIELRIPNVAYTAALMAQKFEPSDETKLLRVRAAILAKNYDEARRVLVELLSKQPKNLEALVLADWVEEHHGDKTKAASYRARVLKIDPLAYSKIPLPTESESRPEPKSDQQKR